MHNRNVANPHSQTKVHYVVTDLKKKAYLAILEMKMHYCKIHGRYIISGLQENVYLAICEMKPLHYQKSHCIVYGFRRKEGYIAIVEMSLSHCPYNYAVSSSKNVALDCFIFK